jgi:hypothetical protein
MLEILKNLIRLGFKERFSIIKRKRFQEDGVCGC